MKVVGPQNRADNLISSENEGNVGLHGTSVLSTFSGTKIIPNNCALFWLPDLLISYTPEV